VLGEFVAHNGADFVVVLAVAPVGSREAFEVRDRLDVPNDDAGHAPMKQVGGPKVHSGGSLVRLAAGPRVRLAFAAACPEADLFRGLANALIPQGP
jgi:hypothetical protein